MTIDSKYYIEENEVAEGQTRFYFELESIEGAIQVWVEDAAGNFTQLEETA